MRCTSAGSGALPQQSIYCKCELFAISGDLSTELRVGCSGRGTQRLFFCSRLRRLSAPGLDDAVYGAGIEADKTEMRRATVG